MTNFSQVGFAMVFMAWNGTLWNLHKDWTFSGALIASGLPAALYALQNTLLQLGYRNLDSLTFSMLNQSKLLFTALFMFLILRYKRFSECPYVSLGRSYSMEFCCIVTNYFKALKY
jgi:UDP-sugar transporter A1/2/3